MSIDFYSNLIQYSGTQCRPHSAKKKINSVKVNHMMKQEIPCLSQGTKLQFACCPPRCQSHIYRYGPDDGIALQQPLCRLTPGPRVTVSHQAEVVPQVILTPQGWARQPQQGRKEVGSVITLAQRCHRANLLCLAPCTAHRVATTWHCTPGASWLRLGDNIGGKARLTFNSRTTGGTK